MQVSKISFNGNLSEAGSLHKDYIYIGENVYEKGQKYALLLDRVNRGEDEFQKEFYEEPQIVEFNEFSKWENDGSIRSVIFKNTKGKEFMLMPNNPGGDIKLVNDGKVKATWQRHSAQFQLMNKEEFEDRINYHKEQINKCKHLIDQLA